MRYASIIGLAVLCLLVAGGAWAHHDAFVLGTARITQSVRVGGQLVQPGTYEIRITGGHLKPLPGQSEEAGHEFELVSEGTVVARDYAEVIPGSAPPAGTTGPAAPPLAPPRRRRRGGPAGACRPAAGWGVPARLGQPGGAALPPAPDGGPLAGSR